MAHSHSYQQLKEKAPTDPVSLKEAVSFLKSHTRRSFDETIEAHIKLGVDPEKSDQMVRGSVNLPAGSVKQQKIIVFAEDAALQKEAKEAGAADAGGEELISAIKDTGTLSADITVSTPAMMPKVAQVARVLGPRGLMPSPKTGTVSEQPSNVVKDLMSGKTSFKMDQQGNVHIALAKASWDQKKIMSNIEAFLSVLNGLKPASAKGEFICSITIKSTMSPSLRISTKPQS